MDCSWFRWAAKPTDPVPDQCSRYACPYNQRSSGAIGSHRLVLDRFPIDGLGRLSPNTFESRCPPRLAPSSILAHCHWWSLEETREAPLQRLSRIPSLWWVGESSNWDRNASSHRRGCASLFESGPACPHPSPWSFSNSRRTGTIHADYTEFTIRRVQLSWDCEIGRNRSWYRSPEMSLI